MVFLYLLTVVWNQGYDQRIYCRSEHFLNRNRSVYLLSISMTSLLVLIMSLFSKRVFTRICFTRVPWYLEKKYKFCLRFAEFFDNKISVEYLLFSPIILRNIQKNRTQQYVKNWIYFNLSFNFVDIFLQ